MNTLQIGNFDKRKLFTTHDDGPIEVAKASSQARARRLVACWNVCQGMSTKDLELAAERLAATSDNGEIIGMVGATLVRLPK